MQVVLLSLPVLIFLIVKTTMDPPTAQVETINVTGVRGLHAESEIVHGPGSPFIFFFHLQTTYDYNYVNITYCFTRQTDAQYIPIAFFSLLLAVFATVFGTLNSNIPARYREDSSTSFRAIAIFTILLSVDYIAELILLEDHLVSAKAVWAGPVISGLIAAILTILYVPKVHVHVTGNI